MNFIDIQLLHWTKVGGHGNSGQCQLCDLYMWQDHLSEAVRKEFGYIDALIDDLINFLHIKELDFKNIFALFCDIFATYCILYP